jgi:ketosteroid isomerase-like protein
MTRNILLIAAATALLPGCEYAEKKHAPEAVAVNTTADEQAIRGNIDRWLELVRSKDAAAIAQFYSEDGAVMPPNMPLAQGREAIQRTWQAMLQGPGDLTFQTEQLVFSSSGDMALDRGTYRFGDDVGKYVVVWRKIDGDWKAAADIFNSDKPASEG